MLSWIYFHKPSGNYSFNGGGFCRTATSTQGLLLEAICFGPIYTPLEALLGFPVETIMKANTKVNILVKELELWPSELEICGLKKKI